MLLLRAYAPEEHADVVGSQLSAVAGVRHVVIGGRTAGGMVQVMGEVDADVADLVLDVLRGCGLAPDDVVLWRATTIEPRGWGRRRRHPATGRDTTVWAEITGRASEHSRPALVYLLFMAAAGVVAGIGVLNGSSILVVGAMALSPDLLPVCAAAVGLVERRWTLAARAALTLIVGLGVAVLWAAAVTITLRVLGRVDDDLEIADTVLGPSLTTIEPGGVLVALAAGMAAMLAYETASGAAVGVAISVTTIPAAAYIGCSLGLASGNSDGALGVLGTNVACIVIASTLTLHLQRRYRRGTR